MEFKPGTAFTHKQSYIPVKATLVHHDGEGWKKVELTLPFGALTIPIEKFKVEFIEGFHSEPRVEKTLGYFL